MASKSLSRRAPGCHPSSLGSAYASPGLTKSYRSGYSSGLGGVGYSFSRGYSSGYSFSSYIARTSAGFSTFSTSETVRKKTSDSRKRYGCSRVSPETKVRSKSVDSSLYFTRDTGQNKEPTKDTQHDTTLSEARSGSVIRDVNNTRSGVRDISVPRDVCLESSTTRHQETSVYKDNCNDLSKTKETEFESQNKRKTSVFKEGFCKSPTFAEMISSTNSVHESSVPRDFSRSSSVIPDLENSQESLPVPSQKQLSRSHNYQQLHDSAGVAAGARSCRSSVSGYDLEKRSSVSGYDLEKAASWALIGSNTSRASLDMGHTSARRDSLLVR